MESLGRFLPVVIVAAFGAAAGLGPAGWSVGLTCAVGLVISVARGLLRFRHQLGPADLVTLTRASLACVAAALVADAFIGPSSLVTLVSVAVIALVLDAVDGRVARWTGTSSAFGGRFDGETDAFLMLVLSVFVARSFGGWVLVIGAMRYLFAMAGWCLPWLRRQLPFREWRKVVTAAQGIVLTFAAADVLPRLVTYVALALALAVLSESFARDVLWLWSRERRRRAEGAAAVRPSPARPLPGSRTHAAG